MKKYLITALLSIALGIATVAYSADGDIVQAEVIEDVATWTLDTVKFLAISQTAEITYRKVDSNGESTGLEKVILFINTPNDPETLEDETSNEFSQLINLINNNSNIKTSIETAVKVKLGL